MEQQFVNIFIDYRGEKVLQFTMPLKSIYNKNAFVNIRKF